MAGLWVSVGSRMVAGRRGQRLPQQLMRRIALWTLKVRSNGASQRPGLHWASSPALPCSGRGRGERLGGLPVDTRGPYSSVVGAANSLSLRSSRWSGAQQESVAAAGTRRIVEGRRAQGASWYFFLPFPRDWLTDLWQ